MLKLQPTEPEWLGKIASNDPEDLRPFLLPGVRVRFAPIGIKAVRAAREALRDALLADEDDALGASDALAAELIRLGVVEWEGVGDAAGDLIPVSPAAAAAFADDHRTFEAACEVYIAPWLARDLEGNVSAGSPSGIGAEATPASDTAPLAAPQTSADDATSAPTASTRPTPKKARRSGRS